ncbi:MAG: ATP-binding protein [Planctomycetales bacterium]
MPTTEEQLLQQIQELQQQTMQLQKLSTVGELAFSITHEFNNILTTVINYAKLGLRHKDEENRNKSFNKILAAGQRASRITTSLLAYARQKSDQRDLADVTQVVEDLLVLVEKDLQKHRISLVTQFDGHPQAMINVGQIQQVLMNLIINARQAMDEGGKLTLQVRKSSDGKFVEIVVKDTGCGIPKDKLAKIFDRFYSTKTADEQGQGGSGLGLALAREVIEAHEGRIRVESTVGKGTSFILKLQLSQQEAAAPKTPAGNILLSGQKLR